MDEDNGMIEGVGGSDDTPEDAETGKVNPELLSEENVHLWLGLSTLIEGSTGFVPED